MNGHHNETEKENSVAPRQRRSQHRCKTTKSQKEKLNIHENHLFKQNEWGKKGSKGVIKEVVSSKFDHVDYTITTTPFVCYYKSIYHFLQQKQNEKKNNPQVGVVGHLKKKSHKGDCGMTGNLKKYGIFEKEN